MRTKLLLTVAVFLISAAGPVYAMEGMAGHGSGTAGDAAGHEPKASQSTGTFTHHENTKGLQAEFEIMSLASMNMNDAQGATHHVMLKLVDNASHKPIERAEGKIKIIGPDEREQISDLKDYGGILAANVNFDAPGKYGVICLFRADGQKHLVKFWYPHEG